DRRGGRGLQRVGGERAVAHGAVAAEPGHERAGDPGTRRAGKVPGGVGRRDAERGAVPRGAAGVPAPVPGGGTGGGEWVQGAGEPRLRRAGAGEARFGPPVRGPGGAARAGDGTVAGPRSPLADRVGGGGGARP